MILTKESIEDSGDSFKAPDKEEEEVEPASSSINDAAKEEDADAGEENDAPNEAPPETISNDAPGLL